MAVHIGRKSVHIEPDLLRITEHAASRKIREARVEKIVHLPELALGLRGQGDFESAARHYKLAIRLNPRYADAYFNLALLCERNNNLLQAVGYWQQYLKLDSTSAWAGTARKQIERLKKTLRSK